ncbi:TetR family transcriptional regulator [Ruminococcaceae bacterium R-25]|nr:TetR family transcriptional regulator [Ruminococcaceae bacterium R-25]SUQ11983.1 transcriptional regulator, TetR family [Oscillospiraceae bacterium]
MDTKQKILDEALTLFSEKGYANVFVGDIAQAVGIKAPSLYKHYKSKKAIFDAIIDKMNANFAEQAKAMQINGTDAAKDAGIYKSLPEDQLLKLGREFFLYYLHDDYNRKFRKMLTLEQFHDNDLAKMYSKLYVDDPLSYQGMLFGFMVTAGVLKTDNVQIMTLHFYAPIYYLLTICDREPEREPEALKLLDEHIKQFDRIYGREN